MMLLRSLVILLTALGASQTQPIQNNPDQIKLHDGVNFKMEEITRVTPNDTVKVILEVKNSRRQDEDEDAGLMDKLKNFATNIFSDNFSLGKLFSETTKFIPGGGTRDRVDGILDSVASPLNVILEKPIQQVQQYFQPTTTTIKSANAGVSVVSVPGGSNSTVIVTQKPSLQSEEQDIDEEEEEDNDIFTKSHSIFRS